MNQLRNLAPQVLGILVRRTGDFAGAEDAVQEALVEAAATWPVRGEPDDPKAWLVRVASRRLSNQYRADAARRRREELAAAWSLRAPDPAPSRDDTLVLMLLCCHPALAPDAAIPLTLRAVGGLTTREIAAAFLVPEATMAQRVSRAKAKMRRLDEPFRLPPGGEMGRRLASVLKVLYLVFNEGYVTSAGPELVRNDLADEAIRLTRLLADVIPDDGGIRGLLGLMLLSESRRPARTSDDGALVPLAEQDRSKWDPTLIAEGLVHTTAALGADVAGEYTLLAAINAVHAQAPTHEATRWADVAHLYEKLEHTTRNPVVRLNRAVAVAMVEGPLAALALLDDLDGPLGDHHRLAAVRAHLYEQAGRAGDAAAEYRAAAGRTANLKEREFLLNQAARVTTYGCRPSRGE